MASSSGCAPAAAGQSSAPAAPRDAIVWPSDGAAPIAIRRSPDRTSAARACFVELFCLSRRDVAGDQRFGRQYRLLTPADFAAVFAARRIIHGESFALHYRANGLDHARLGLVVPKKMARRAVLRNALKRQARERFRLRRATLPAVDVVLRLMRPPPPDKSRWRAEIDALLDRLARSLKEATA